MSQKSSVITIGVIITIAVTILIGIIATPFIDLKGMSIHGIGNIFNGTPEETNIEEFEYEVNELGLITITGYNGDSQEVIIPEQIEDKDVMRIGYMAFSSKKLEDVTIPDTVKEIMPNAFSNNEIATLEIPETVISIGSGAFYKNKLTDVYIYNQDISLGHLLFQNNGEIKIYGYTGSTAYDYANKYEYITFIPLDSEIDENYLYEDNGDGTATIIGYTGTDTSITIPSEIGGLRVTIIGSNAFYNKSLREVTLPSTLQEVKANAFENNRLREIRLPEQVSKVAQNAFNMNRLDDVYIYNSDTEFEQNVFQNQERTPTVLFGYEGSTTEAYANRYEYLEFQSLSQLISNDSDFLYSDNGNGTATITGYTGNARSIQIPEKIEGLTVIKIGNHALKDHNFRSVEIANSVTTIGLSAFENSKIQNVSLPTSITTIEANAFKGNNLKSISIPNKVEGIAEGAFKDNQLNDISFPDGLTHIEAEAFMNNKFTELTFPDQLNMVSRSSFENNELKEIEINSKLTTIGKRAFAGNQLSEVEMPENVLTIDTEAFAENGEMNEVVIFNKFLIFEGDVFKQSQTILYGYLDSTAEKHADEYEHVEFKALDSRETDPSLFEYRNNGNGTATITGYKGSLDSIVIPSKIDGLTITKIGDNAMNYNQTSNKIRFESVIIPDSVTEIGNSAFDSTNIARLVLSNNLVKIGNKAFFNNKLNTLTIPQSVKTIGNSAFENNELETLYLQAGIESIGNLAFKNGKIMNLDLPETVKKMGKEAFRSNNIKSVSIPDSLTVLEERVFESNNIEIMDMPSTIKEIQNGALRENNLMSFTFYSSLERVGDQAFAGNDLTDVIAYSKFLDYGEEVFAGNKKVDLYGYIASTSKVYANIYDNLTFMPLDTDFETPSEWFTYIDNGDGTATITGYNGDATDITIPEEIEGLTVVSIRGLSNKGLTNITLPATLREISSTAFRNNNLRFVELPSSVTRIGGFAFGDNPIHTFYVFNKDKNYDLLSVTSFQRSNDEIHAKVYGYEGSAIEPYVDLYNESIRNTLTFIPLPSIETPYTYFEYEDHGDGTATITGYNGRDMDLVIPSEIKGLKVIGIGSRAFYNKGLTSVHIPDSVTTIINRAFANNNLESVHLSKNVTYIDDYAFDNNKITNITLPDSLKTIGIASFGRNKLTSLTIPSSVTNLGYSAFAFNELTSVSIPNSITSLPHSLFENNNLTEVTIPSSVTSIQSYVFASNELANISIPDSVTTIGSYAFSENKITQVNLPKSLTHIQNGAFYQNKLSEVVIPENVKLIGRVAFAYNNLEDVIVYATDIMFEHSIINGSIAQEAFEHNGSIKLYAYRYTDPANYANARTYIEFVPLTPIEDFQYHVYQGQIRITGYTGRATTIVVPNEIDNLPVVNIGDGAFKAKDLTEVKIMEGISTIDDQAFYDNQITKINIPDSVYNIGKNAFGLNRIQEIKLPSKLTSIPDHAFSRNNLTEITIPDSVTSIGQSAFFQNRLSKVTIGKNTRTIDNSAFAYNRLKDVLIPESVTSFGSNVFFGNSLETVSVYSTNVSYGNQVFGNNSMTLYGYINSTSQQYANNNSNITFRSFLSPSYFGYRNNGDGTATITSYNGYVTGNQHAIIPPKINGLKVTAINPNVFASTNLRSVVLPEGLETIGFRAFQYNQLTEVSIPKSVKEIGLLAFGDNSLSDIYVYSKNVTYGNDVFANNGQVNLFGYRGTSSELYSNLHYYLQYRALD